MQDFFIFFLLKNKRNTLKIFLKAGHVLLKKSGSNFKLLCSSENPVRKFEFTKSN